MKKFTIAILLIILTTSCGAITDNIFGNFPDSHYFYERFPNNKRAIIIVKSYSKRRKPKAKIWCRISQKSNEIEAFSKCIKINFSNINKMLMIEPGTYILTKYRDDSRDEFLLNNDFKTLSKGRNSVSFKAIESKINYVGAHREEGSYNKIDDEYLNIKSALKQKNFQFLQENFDNLDHELNWLIKSYDSSEKIFIKNLAKVNFKSDNELTNQVERFIDQISKNNSDLRSLSKVIALMDKIIKVKKEIRKDKRKSRR